MGAPNRFAKRLVEAGLAGELRLAGRIQPRNDRCERMMLEALRSVGNVSQPPHAGL